MGSGAKPVRWEKVNRSPAFIGATLPHLLHLALHLFAARQRDERVVALRGEASKTSLEFRAGAARRVRQHEIAVGPFEIGESRFGIDEGDADQRIRFLPFHPYDLTWRLGGKSFWRFGKGGWLETVALVEALLAGGLVTFGAWMLAGESDAVKGLSSVLGVGAACVVWCALLRRADTLYQRELEEGRDGSGPLRGIRRQFQG